MAFSTGFGLTCMCFIMLLFLPGQGLRPFTKTKPRKARALYGINCCTETSKGLINKAVDACYVQDKCDMICPIHAYIFVTRSNKELCVDPNASWLPARFEKLKKRGITCKPLV